MLFVLPGESRCVFPPSWNAGVAQPGGACAAGLARNGGLLPHTHCRAVERLLLLGGLWRWVESSGGWGKGGNREKSPFQWPEQPSLTREKAPRGRVQIVTQAVSSHLSEAQSHKPKRRSCFAPCSNLSSFSSQQQGAKNPGWLHCLHPQRSPQANKAPGSPS